MSALALKNLTARPVQTQSLRMFLARSALDALVSARATRTVPEWQMRQVRREIDRCYQQKRKPIPRQIGTKLTAASPHHHESARIR
jgi:hypothetical protein